jgi:hypothetical protein
MFLEKDFFLSQTSNQKANSRTEKRDREPVDIRKKNRQRMK